MRSNSTPANIAKKEKPEDATAAPIENEHRLLEFGIRLPTVPTTTKAPWDKRGQRDNPLNRPAPKTPGFLRELGIGNRGEKED